jgi:signal transduction histidine kinase
MFLDITLSLATILILIFTHYKAPKKPEEVTSFHQYLVNIWVLFHILWATCISIIDYSNTNSIATLLIGVFSAATIFLVRGFVFFIFLILSFTTLLFGLIFIYDISINLFVTQYSPIIVLIMLAWLLSLILFNTRVKSFVENKNLETAKNNLDVTVKERTKELSETNIALKEEIKERKRYEKDLKKEKKKAEEADRLKTVFLANMSHEIRTPLNGILGFSDLLQNQHLPEDKKLRYLEIINNNGERLLKLIDDIIDISMIESNQLKTNKVRFSLSQVLADALDFFEDYKRINDKEHILIINDGFPKEVNDKLLLDPSRVQQVLYNLLSNAVKFTETGTIRFGGKYHNAYALIYVEDSGIGIDEQQCHTIFQRFRQGEESITRKFGGTGLGLSISKGIVELLGGMIWVDLSYTNGTRICFTLPTEDIVEEDRNILSLENIKLLDKKCLVIHEDTETSKEGFVPILKSTASAVCTFVSLRKYNPKTLKFKPEVIIIDIPDKKQEMLKSIQKTQESFSECHIIAVADNASMSTKELVEAGCSLVLDTPVNYQVFLLYIRGLLS